MTTTDNPAAEPYDVKLTSFVTKMIGHQRTMAAGLVEVVKGIEQIAAGYEALRLDVEALTTAAHQAGREAAARDIESADTSGWPGGRGSDVDGCQERAAEVARGGGR